MIIIPISLSNDFFGRNSHTRTGSSFEWQPKSLALSLATTDECVPMLFHFQTGIESRSIEKEDDQLDILEMTKLHTHTHHIHGWSKWIVTEHYISASPNILSSTETP